MKKLIPTLRSMALVAFCCIQTAASSQVTTSVDWTHGARVQRVLTGGAFIIPDPI